MLHETVYPHVVAFWLPTHTQNKKPLTVDVTLGKAACMLVYPAIALFDTAMPHSSLQDLHMIY